jgi:hypothetical protein
MSEWAIGNAFQPAEQFVLQRYMLRRIPRALGGALEVPKGARLVTRSAARRIGGRSKGEDRRLSCRLPEGVVTVPLYSLDSPEQLERLAVRKDDVGERDEIGVRDSCCRVERLLARA